LEFDQFDLEMPFWDIIISQNLQPEYLVGQKLYISVENYELVENIF